MHGIHHKAEADSLYRGALLLAAGSLALMSLATCVSLLKGAQTRRDGVLPDAALRLGRGIRFLPRS